MNPSLALLVSFVRLGAAIEDAVIRKLLERRNGQRPSTDELIGCRDPECHMDMEGIVKSKGYPCERHSVITDDNINLTLFRIPYGRNENKPSSGRPAVFLQHGLLASSEDWVINFPSHSFGFMLADAGLDVWLGNVRGNTYGTASLPRNATEAQRKRFYAFSFDEMAKYDVPAMIEASLEMSGQAKLAAYIGHSQGTSIGFILFSQRPQWAQRKVSKFYALAPIAYMAHSTSPLGYLGDFSESPTFVHFLEYLLGGVEFLPRNQLIDTLCSLAPQTLCGNFLLIVAGYDEQHMNNRLPVYTSISPAGTSSQNLIYFGQLLHTGKFRAFDFFAKENRKHYGQPTPPSYDVGTLGVPVGLYWGEGDILADPTDVAALRKDLGAKVFVAKQIPQMGHLGFTWALNAAQEVYQPIIDQLKVRSEVIS